MTRLFLYLSLLSEALNRICKTIASTGIVVMLVCILFQVMARYIFNEPPAWTEELARYAMIWAGFTGATVAFKGRADPALFSANKLVRPWLRKSALWFEAGAVFLFWIPVLLAMPQFLILQSQRASEALEIPNVAIVSVMPASILIILLHMIVRLLPAHDPNPPYEPHQEA
ncbi:TRAP transporter small permease [Luteithermobacter gelatinilyticus]|uniref:TRAP transporter small permease n=1 Tax=Luteithermobacter gelatinilyticus TaxID=2582913 RepID=UPI0011074E12|nr:TRAP transporter small permease subunit [Luteithermobacter gelatinilyticus]